MLEDNKGKAAGAMSEAAKMGADEEYLHKNRALRNRMDKLASISLARLIKLERDHDKRLVDLKKELARDRQANLATAEQNILQKKQSQRKFELIPGWSRRNAPDTELREQAKIEAVQHVNGYEKERYAKVRDQLFQEREHQVSSLEKLQRDAGHTSRSFNRNTHMKTRSQEQGRGL